jgi:hypothetical protein
MKITSILLALVLGLSVVSFGQAVEVQKADAKGVPKLIISELQHNFGDVKKGTLAQYSFTFKNEGTAELLITNVQPGCGCTTSDFTKSVLPGKEGKITLAVHTDGFMGTITKSAQVFSNDPASAQFVLAMSMNVVEPPATGPKLVIAKTQHDFGEIKKGITAQYSFKFKNEGATDLLITNVAPACGCTTTDYSRVIPPGKEGQVSLALNTESYQGTLTKTAEVFTNDPVRPQFTLQISMVIITPEGLPNGKRIGSLIVSPVDRWSTQVPVGFPVSGLFSIYHDNPQPLKITKVEAGGETFKVTLNTLEEGKRFAVNFVGKEGLPLGVYRQTIKLMTDSKETPELSFDLDLRIVPPVNVNPGKLAFDNVPVSTTDYDISGLSKFTWVTVTRSGGLEITNLTSDLPFIKAKVESVDNLKQTYLLRVGFNAKPTAGKHTGVIKIETNNKEIPLIEVPITVNAQ